MFSDPTFWVAVAFVIFVALVFNPVRKIMGGALDKRAETIRGQLDEAQALREEAQKTLAEYKRMQRDAVKQAEEIVEKARHEASSLRAEAERELEEQLKRRERQAMEKIEQAEANALAEVRNTAVDLAIAATGRLLAEQLEEQGDDKLVEQAIKDLPSRLN